MKKRLLCFTLCFTLLIMFSLPSGDTAHAASKSNTKTGLIGMSTLN